MSRPDAPESPADPAADHGRRLLRALELPCPVPDRATPLAPPCEWAASGAMALTGPAQGPPGFASGGLATAARGAGLALAAVCPGRGFDSLDAPALLGERAALFGLARAGPTSCGGSAKLLPAGREWIALNLPRDDDWRMLEAWLEQALPGAAQARDWSAVARAVGRHPAEPLVERGREIGLAVARAATTPRPGAAPFRLEAESRALPRPRAPRVLDLSTLWAGPLAGSLLARAGCDVLKLESPSRPDGARLGTRAGERSFFDLLNADKRGVALELSEANDRARFARLLDAADVVLESARPRALAQLGFDARAWVGGRPGRIWASITGHGREREWIAFGDDAAVAAGLAFDPGDAKAAPRFCGDAIADPLTGLYGALTIAALLRQGRGGLLSLSLEAVTAHAAAAGSTAAADRVRPILSRGSDWAIADERRVLPVAPPRARPTAARAPALARPDDDLLARWESAC